MANPVSMKGYWKAVTVYENILEKLHQIEATFGENFCRAVSIFPGEDKKAILKISFSDPQALNIWLPPELSGSPSKISKVVIPMLDELIAAIPNE